MALSCSTCYNVGKTYHGVGMREVYLFLEQLQFFCLNKLLRDSSIALLRVQAKIPEFFTEGCRVFFQKASELNLQ